MPKIYPPAIAAKIIDGKALADSILENVAKKVAKLAAPKPKLVVIITQGNPSSEIYVGRKESACEKVGIISERIDIPQTTSADELLAIIRRLNADDSVDGILVQTPLPKKVDSDAIFISIDPKKDVDGFHPQNIGKVLTGSGEGGLTPCTPKACMTILDHIGFDPAGKVCMVIGTSNIVGKPLAAMLINKKATVITANSRTPDIGALSRTADLIIVAVGKPGLLKGGMVKQGAVIIDVGITRLENGKVAGDVDFESVAPKASRITPVPGGVGPMTVATLMENTLLAHINRRKK